VATQGSGPFSPEAQKGFTDEEPSAQNSENKFKIQLKLQSTLHRWIIQ